MSNSLTIKNSQQVDSQLVKDAHFIREMVFVNEQGVPLELEYDGTDNEATHFVGYVDQTPVVTARVTITAQGAHIQRVATLKQFRRHGYARELLLALMDTVSTQFTEEIFYLDAQLTAIPFYETLGFQTVGTVFMDAGIQHKKMIKTN